MDHSGYLGPVLDLLLVGLVVGLNRVVAEQGTVLRLAGLVFLRLPLLDLVEVQFFEFLDEGFLAPAKLDPPLPSSLHVKFPGIGIVFHEFNEFVL